MPSTSFQRDIAPLFDQYKGQMMWRFDLTSYEAVKGNADLILLRLQGGGGGVMPPPGFPPLSQEQIDTFQRWINEEFPP